MVQRTPGPALVRAVMLPLVLLAFLAVAPSASAAADPTGTYTGTHKDYDYGDCVSCLDEPAVVEVVPVRAATTSSSTGTRPRRATRRRAVPSR